MTSSPDLRRAAFLDRDGVINEERHYVHRVEDFALVPGTIEALQLLRADGWRLVVITNQAGIAKGLYGVADMEALHAHMQRLLAGSGVAVDAIYNCPHHPAGSVAGFAVDCDCRKPKPGMILRAARELGLDLPSSILIGDKRSDIEAGRAAGVGRNVLVRSGHAIDAEDERTADFVADDLLSAVRRLLPHRP